MKIISLFAFFLSFPALAATYDCALETNAGRAPLFQIDFTKQDNAETKIPGIGDIGCVALHLYPEVFSCTIAAGDGKSMSAVAELGSAVLRLQADTPDSKLAVQCSKIY